MSPFVDDWGTLWAWQWADAFAAEQGGLADADGPLAACGDPPQEHMEEFYDDDLGLDDFG